jgi:hypothetical protein
VVADAGEMLMKYLGGFAEEVDLIFTARKSGHCVVYCLKAFVAAASVRTQWSHNF